MNQIPQQLLAEAADWRLLALLFECPSENWRRRVAELAKETSDSTLRVAASRALEEASEGLYHSIFGPGGPAPPREASYRDTVQLGQLLAEVNAYYQAFAYQPGAAEAPDHLSYELGFLAYLRLKEAYAAACGDTERAAIAAEAARTFQEDHVAVIAAPLAATLSNCVVEYLDLAAQALLRRAGPPKSASPLPVVSCADSDDCEISCSVR
jgi:nitrate reductase assembly molybdenum cofactor insertion protein NarJ